MVGRAVETCGVQAHENGIRITFRPAVPVPVLGSPTSLTRAVTALLDNAVRHASTDVTVALHVGRSQTQLDITDDGAGIAPEVLPTLFDRFATAPADRRTTGRRRYGLGLALVNEISAQHHGTIAATSTEHGACFRLTLPNAPGNSKNLAPS